MENNEKTKYYERAIQMEDISGLSPNHNLRLSGKPIGAKKLYSAPVSALKSKEKATHFFEPSDFIFEQSP